MLPRRRTAPARARGGKDGRPRRRNDHPVNAPTAPLQRVLGRYALGPVIGRGATAVVHRARDLRSGREVAVKAVPADLGLAPRVRAEVRAAGRLEHPGVVRLLDWGEDRDHLYLVWELIDGPSLSQVLRGPEPPGDREMLRIAQDVLDALAHAHERGVVHRDVKPGNILLAPDGRAVLSDFGVARLSGESGLTMTGGVVGTVAYMAPEQARGEGAGAPADVYAACLVLYQGLTGVNPIAGDTPAETARRAAAGAVPPLARERPDLTARLTRAVDAGLARDPRARPAARDLVMALAAARGGVAGARRRGRIALPAAASAAGGAALGAAAVWLADGRLEEAAGVEPRGPAALAAAAAVGGLAFAWRPRAAAVLAVAAAAALTGLGAPAAGAVLGVAGLLALALGAAAGADRVTLLPAAAPLLFAIGLGPLYALAAGLVPRWPARLWAAAAGMAAALAWQVATGAELLATRGAPPPAIDALGGERSPLTAAERLWEPIAARPEAPAQAGVLVVAALCAPVVTRAAAGAPRVAAAAAWTVATGVGLIAAGGVDSPAPGAALAAGIVVLAWALRPWRALWRRSAREPSATLRAPVA